MLSACGFSACQMVSGSNPVDLFGCAGGDEDMMFAQDASLAGHFTQQWKLRAKAQEATLKDIAKSKLRRLLARNKTPNCAEIDVGDMAIFYKAQNRKSSLRWGGPAKVQEIDETGVTVSFQIQHFKVARYYVGKRMKDSEVTGSGGEFFPLLGTREWARLRGTRGWHPCYRRMRPRITRWGRASCRPRVVESLRIQSRSLPWPPLA